MIAVCTCVWILKFFCNSDFPWNQFWQYLAFLPFLEALAFHQNNKSESLKLPTRNFLRLQIFQKLILHYKIFLNFHVNCNFSFFYSFYSLHRKLPLCDSSSKWQVKYSEHRNPFILRQQRFEHRNENARFKDEFQRMQWSCNACHRWRIGSSR